MLPHKEVYIGAKEGQPRDQLTEIKCTDHFCETSGPRNLTEKDTYCNSWMAPTIDAARHIVINYDETAVCHSALGPAMHSKQTRGVPTTESDPGSALIAHRLLIHFCCTENAAIGTTVGRILAVDGDTGINAKMTYSLEDDLEESATFIIHTDPDTQEGVLVLAKPLDYEAKRRYVMAAEALNEHPDLRFLPLDDFSDRTTLKVVVEDVDEPPVFLQQPYEWKIPENAEVGSVVGSVSARDTDIVDNPVRYAIDKRSDDAKTFKIDPQNGTVSLAKAWIERVSTVQLHLSSSVVVFVKVLDVNDNVPRLANDYQPFICEGTQAGELIQLLSAVDPDEPAEGHHFYFSMVPDKHINPNFTIRDNQDNTAGIVARRSTFTRKDRTHYLLPVVVTSTLTISVCSCQPAGHCPSSGVEALALSMGVSLQTLLGLLVSLVTLTVLSVLLLILRKHRQKQHDSAEVKELDLPETVSQKVLYYGDSNRGARVDFCQPIVPLRQHPKRRERRLKRDEVRASIRMSLRHSHLIGPEDEVFRQFILDRLEEADQDPYVPPYDRVRILISRGTVRQRGL
ncbi:hypothetical protein WMY93_029537 [Mugilogobius chulae]|uniref:Cadherin domain-containing protein n=1 Tax=Mugilogobius chulae TaxID=88201 RepID=A0AAW0MXA6_9GOBI